MELRDIFSIPMIISQIVIWILWSFLQLALGSEVKDVLLNPLNPLFLFNLIFGVVYQISQAY
ncbi:hypothetical protein ACIQXI_02400 [Lysinibacillus sp. NPDC097195]|uniref:hypothetical protein n=1 Tax=Lysinibacillus sp. NPDC097195 TaxID=3364141 RepID=UPI0037FD8397